MKSVASTPLRFVGMVVAINAAIIAVVASAVAIIASKYLKSVAHRFDNLLHTARFSNTIHHVDQAGIIGLIVATVVAAGIVLCLRTPRLATLAFLGAAIAGVILTPFVFAIPAFILLNASVFVFFGRKETPIHLIKAKTLPVEEPRVEPPLAEPLPAEATS